MTDLWRPVMDAGVEVVPVDAWHVELRDGDRAVRLRLHVFSRPLKPSDVLGLIEQHGEPGLFVFPAATAAVREAVERAGWSWLTTGPTGVRGVLRVGDIVISVGAPETRGNPVPSRPGPVPWGSLTVVRRLLQRPAATQQSLAAAAGVSQPRVSQTLTALADTGLVERRGGEWVVGDFDGLLRWWLDRYPGPGGISTYWYGLDPLRDQAGAAVRLLWTVVPTGAEAARVQPAVVSGDVAADLLAPWRAPAQAVIYARVGADLSGAGLTPSGAEEATLELILPEDKGVWAAHGDLGRPGSPMPVADPIQILWDVRRGSGPDSDEAAERLWQFLRDRHRRSQRTDAS